MSVWWSFYRSWAHNVTSLPEGLIHPVGNVRTLFPSVIHDKCVFVLCLASAACGHLPAICRVQTRTPSTISIVVGGEEEMYQLLSILDFNNMRKRMSVGTSVFLS